MLWHNRVNDVVALGKYSIEAGYCLEGFGIVPGYTGEGMKDIFSRWAKLIGS
jgi:hypothetical protein